MILGMPSIQLKKIIGKKELSFLAYNIHQCKRILSVYPKKCRDKIDPVFTEYYIFFYSIKSRSVKPDQN